MLNVVVQPVCTLPIPDEQPAFLVFVHGSLSDRRFWRTYRPSFARTADIDLIGYGTTPARPDERLTLSGEAARLRDLIVSLDAPAHVVAHSYGGAVALRLAVESPELVSSLTVVEPVCFQTLRELGSAGASARAEIEFVAARIDRFIEAGDLAAGAEVFVDFWNGPGAWSMLPPERRERLATGIIQVARNFAAIASEPLRLVDYRECLTPTLIVTGSHSPAPARQVAAALATTMPQGRLYEVAGAGHMLPLTHAETFAALLRRRYWFCLSERDGSSALSGNC